MKMRKAPKIIIYKRGKLLVGRSMNQLVEMKSHSQINLQITLKGAKMRENQVKKRRVTVKRVRHWLV
jgi:hypothetical protein